MARLVLASSLSRPSHPLCPHPGLLPPFTPSLENKGKPSIRGLVLHYYGGIPDDPSNRPPQVRPVERTVAGSHGTRRHTCETTRQHAVRNGVHAGQAPTHETQHKYSMHHDVEWRRQSMRMRSNVLCITTQSVTCKPGGRVGLASNATPMHLNLHAANMLTPFRAGRAGGAGGAGGPEGQAGGQDRRTKHWRTNGPGGTGEADWPGGPDYGWDAHWHDIHLDSLRIARPKSCHDLTKNNSQSNGFSHFERD